MTGATPSPGAKLVEQRNPGAMKIWSILALASVAGAPARADLTATYRSTMAGVDMAMKVEVAANGNLRADMNSPGLYLIKREGRTYLITPGPDRPVVEDVEDVGAAVQEELTRMDPHFCDRMSGAAAESSFSLVSKGTFTVAGRPGEAFSTPSRTATLPVVVISHDPALAPLGAAMAAQFRISMGLMERCASGTPMFAQMQRLLDSGTPLKFGPMQLEKVESGTVDPARFVLPAAPATREQVRALITRRSGAQATGRPEQPK